VLGAGDPRSAIERRGFAHAADAAGEVAGGAVGVESAFARIG